MALQSAAAACGCDIPTVVANIAATLLTVGGGVAKGDRATSGALIKADDVKRVATYVAYPVNKADAGLAADGHRDFASKDEVERLAWNWMAKGARLGLWHLHGTDDYETVESGLHHGPDWVIKATDGSIQTVTEGDWIVSIRAKTQEAWELAKQLVGGVSMQGTAKRREPSAAALASLRS